jgi:hypothetical protein
VAVLVSIVLVATVLTVVAMVAVMVFVVPVPVVFVVLAVVFVFSAVFSVAVAGPGAIVFIIVASVAVARVAVAGRLLGLRLLGLRLGRGRRGGGSWLRSARIDGRLRRCGSGGTRSEGDALRRGRLRAPGRGEWRPRRSVLWRHLDLNGFMAEGWGRAQASEREVGRVRAQDAHPEDGCGCSTRGE